MGSITIKEEEEEEEEVRAEQGGLQLASSRTDSEPLLVEDTHKQFSST